MSNKCAFLNTRKAHTDRSFIYLLQSVSMPNGLIAHMFGLVEGRRHDAFVLAETGLLNKMRRFRIPNGEPYVI